MARRAVLLAFVILFCCAATGETGQRSDTRSDPPAIEANDNRLSAGVRTGTMLSLDLDAVSGLWFPDGEDKQGVPMQAFAERGHVAQIPGPLIRVPVGTDVRLRVRNLLPRSTLIIHDLVDLPSHDDKQIAIPSGTERIVRIHAFEPGTYHYWASTTNEALTDRFGADSQLSGAIVVDPLGSVPVDRIFVLGSWGNVRNAAGRIDQNYKIVTINGRSWPATERLSYAQGERVTWRVINTSAVNHPMHLHGFAFNVIERGDGLSNAPAMEREVTELIRPGGTAQMKWNAERPGTWLYHCHLVPHSIAHVPTPILLAGKPALDFEHVYKRPIGQAMDMRDEMGGMILEVTIRRSSAVAAPLDIVPSRHIQLIVRAKIPASPAAGAALATQEPVVPALEYVVREAGTTSAAVGADARTIVLTRGVGVGIDVVNELSEPTSVHWHGIEVASSYYDGVAGLPDGDGRVAPMVAPGAMFEAKFTPPRAGTFIYHAHADDYWQLLGGLAGPLIVLEPGRTFDPATDHIVMLTTPRDLRKTGSVDINGRATPDAIVMIAGVSQKLRLINITGVLTDVSVTLAAAPNATDMVPQWRLLARDGYDLPAPIVVPSTIRVSIGQTRDLELTPARPGRYILDVRSPRNGSGSFAIIPVEVTLPGRIASRI